MREGRGKVLVYEVRSVRWKEAPRCMRTKTEEMRHEEQMRRELPNNLSSPPSGDLPPACVRVSQGTVT